MHKVMKWLAVALGLAISGLAALAFLVFVFVILAEDAWGPKPITECRSGLAETHWCRGLNSSWTDCSWGFQAEGRPDLKLCRHFLSSRSTTVVTSDFPEFDRFTRTDCADYGLDANMRCFFSEQQQHLDETNRYLLAFDGACTHSTVLRSCNEPLKTYPSPAQASSESAAD